MEIDLSLSQATAHFVDLDTRVKFFCSVTLEAAHTHIIKPPIDRNRKTWISADVHDANRKRNAAKADWYTTRGMGPVLSTNLGASPAGLGVEMEPFR